MRYHFSAKSSNAKTGPIPVTSTSRDSCPSTCPLKDAGGCYGENYGLNFHWNALDAGKRGTDLSGLCASIAALPDNQLWRGNQVGDLPHNDGAIDAAALGQLVQANIGKRGFTYTHHLPEFENNAFWIAAANQWGLTINLSANDAAQADTYAEMGIAPVVCLLPADAVAHKTVTTPGGRKIVVCPAFANDDLTCADCQLCQRQNRPIIGFPAHGTKSARVIAIATVQ